MKRLRKSLDVVLLAGHVAKVEHDRNRATSVFEKNAGRLAVQVERGDLDPIVAEEQLNFLEAYHTAAADSTSNVPEKASALLERMVVNGSIDPIVAENMLDNFSVSSFETAADLAG